MKQNTKYAIKIYEYKNNNILIMYKLYNKYIIETSVKKYKILYKQKIQNIIEI